MMTMKIKSIKYFDYHLPDDVLEQVEETPLEKGLKMTFERYVQSYCEQKGGKITSEEELQFVYDKFCEAVLTVIAGEFKKK